MNTVNKQTAFELKEAGFPQPEPAFGQVWYSPGGESFVVVINDAITYTAYVFKGRAYTMVFTHDAVAEMAFAPNAWQILCKAPDIHVDLNININADNPHESMAASYLAMKKAERV